MADRPTNTEKIENNPGHLKRAAHEALKTAKAIERARMAIGAKYVPGPNRSWVLKGGAG